MSSWLDTSSFASGLPAHCEPQGAFLLWLSTTFSTCVPTTLAFTTTLLGSLSFFAWLFAQLPQIYKNYKLQSASGLSIYFLVEWLLGDTTNLAGAILTKQATWQILVASYYTFVDVVLVLQFSYYTQYLPWKRGKTQKKPNAYRTQEYRGGSSQGIPEVRTAPRPIGMQKQQPEPKGMWPFGSFHLPGLSLSPYENSPTPSSGSYLRVPAQGTPVASPRTVLMISLLLAVLARAAPTVASQSSSPVLESKEQDQIEIAGRFISWASTFLYLGSRLPQIFKNARRRSTAGLSLSLFVAAFFGNLFYASSLLANPLAWDSYPPYGYYGWADESGSDRITWVQLALPFWLGAAGVLSLDLTIGLQFLMYDDRSSSSRIVAPSAEEETTRGRQSWRQVSGWMRGWVPSPSGLLRNASFSSLSSRLRAESSGPEDERPLLAGSDGLDTEYRRVRQYGGTPTTSSG